MSVIFKDRETGIDVIEEKLKEKLPSYTYKRRGKHILIARKSKFIAAIIIRKKNLIRVSGNFPEFWFSMIFSVIVVLFGILFPVVLYFIFIHRKLVKAEKEVAGMVQSSLFKVQG
jgi:hypothetical protein